MTKRTYDAWRDSVENMLIARTGLDSWSLPDFDYRQAYDNKWSVARTVAAVIAYARRAF